MDTFPLSNLFINIYFSSQYPENTQMNSASIKKLPLHKSTPLFKGAFDLFYSCIQFAPFSIYADYIYQITLTQVF